MSSVDVPTGFGYDLSDDEALEREIETAYRFAMRYAGVDTDLAREAFSIHARLVAKRSPEQVAKLERERGLRA